MVKKLSVVLILVCICFACKRAGSSSSDSQTSTSEDNNHSSSNTSGAQVTPQTPLGATVKVYFENTLSMDGYIQGNTDFKDVSRELLVAVDNEDEIDLKTEFFLLNNKLTPIDFGVDKTKISDKLTPVSTANKGNKGSSNFEEILNTVLQNQESDIISVIMADFIYSPDGQQDTPSALNKLKTYTQDAFLKATSKHKNLETRIYQFTSSFDGTYYDINNKHIKGIEERPYYYFVIAPSSLMNVFNSNIASQLKKNDTFKNEAFFSTKEFKNIPFKVLSSTAYNGRIRDRNGEIEIYDYPHQGELEFTVLVNLRDLPVASSYLTDPANYHLNNKEFSIKNIGLVRGKTLQFRSQKSIKINPSDLITIKDDHFTHAIQFTANGIVSENLQLALKKKVPGWVTQTHSSDDRNISTDTLEQSKTFGFGHLTEGISNAFIQNGDNAQYFEIQIPIKK